MTSPYLLADLRRDEGCRLQAYPDPLSGGEPWTIGYGHTGREVVPGLVWTETTALAVLTDDAVRTAAGLDTAVPWWRSLDDLRQDVLMNMAFQMGVRGLLGFKATLNMVVHGDYASAADHMLDSAWARQTPNRAKRLALQMRTGAHQGT